MPRRYYNYLPQFEAGNLFAGIGAYLMMAGLGLMALNLLVSLAKGAPAPANPWGGSTLEWMVASPPPLHNFAVTPAIKAYPYDFTGIREDPVTRTETA